MRHRLTLTQLAEAIGSTAASICRYESGKTNPSAGILLKLFTLSDDADEREAFYDAILEKLKGQPGPAWDQALLEIQNARRSLHPRFPRHSIEHLLELAKEAEIFLRRSVDVRPALVKILRLYRKHASDPTIQEVFQKAAVYIELEIGQQATRSGKRRRPARTESAPEGEDTAIRHVPLGGSIIP
jgi:transcriptional regulator with XRE-family HTH domain